MTQNHFQLQLDGPLQLDVRWARVEEALNQPFALTLRGVSPERDPDLDALIGAAAAFHIVEAPTCGWTGVVSEVALLSSEAQGLSSYEIHVVPTLWLLTQRRNHRIYQAMSEPAAAIALLAGWEIEPDVRLDLGAYKNREICVQYAESDFAFFSRMLERAGVSYWFEQQGGRSRLVLGDAVHADSRPSQLRYAEPNGAVATSVWGMRTSRQVRPGRYTVGDVDFRRGAENQPLETSESNGATSLEKELETYQYVPGSFLFESESKDVPVADDRLAVRTDTKEATRRVPMRLDAKRGNARAYSFDTTDLSLRPGASFTLLDHPSSAFGVARPLLVTTSLLEASTEELMVRRAEAVSAAAPYRPKLVTPRPVVSGVETATVVGPSNDEIPADEFGRVRVHFHWDRESEMNERSSSYLHVSSPWAGSGFGAIKPPRAGQEVIVAFVGGDPDRPMITGRLYTALQPPPYPLPENKTQSGWKSNSTGGTGGYNELMFEDKAGEELVRMRAQRDLVTNVLNDERRNVDNDRSTLVGRDEKRTVNGNRTRQIDRNGSKVVFGSSDNLVKQDTSHSVVKGYRSNVAENRSEFVGGTRIVNVGGDSNHISLDNDESAGESLKVMVAFVPAGSGECAIYLEANKISLYRGKNSVLELTGPHVTVKSPNVTFSATDVFGAYGRDGRVTGKLVEVSGPDTVDIHGGPIRLQLGGFDAGRLGDAAPATVDEGATKVIVGGPSLPANVRAIGPSVISLDNGITIDGRKKIDGEDENGNFIYVDMTPEEAKIFMGKALANLAIIGATPSGKQMLDDLKKSGKKWKIIPLADQNGYQWGTGKGNSTIAWNPDYDDGPPGLSDRDRAKMPSRVMFHEGKHGVHEAEGTLATHKKMGGGWDNEEEYNTIYGDDVSEEDYMRDLGINQRRNDHDGTWVCMSCGKQHDVGMCP